jgi:hypothetical protein
MAPLKTFLPSWKEKGVIRKIEKITLITQYHQSSSVFHDLGM